MRFEVLEGILLKKLPEVFIEMAVIVIAIVAVTEIPR
jgi:hypothetical protein